MVFSFQGDETQQPVLDDATVVERTWNTLQQQFDLLSPVFFTCTDIIGSQPSQNLSTQILELACDNDDDHDISAVVNETIESVQASIQDDHNYS